MRKHFIFFALITSFVTSHLWCEPELVVQEGNNGSVYYLKYSNDGKYLMSATRNEAKIFEAESGILVKSFTLGRFKDFSPDAKHIVSTSSNDDDRRIFLTNIETRREIVIGETYDAYTVEMSFSTDGRYLAVPMKNWIDIYDIETLKKTSILKDSGYYFYDKIEWSRDGQYLSILSNKSKDEHSDTNIVYHLTSNKIVSQCRLNGVRIKYSKIDNDGKYVVFVSGRIVYIHKLKSNKIKKSFVVDKEETDICSIYFTPDNHSFVIRQKNYVSVYNCSNWQYEYGKELWYISAIACNSKPGRFAVALRRDIEVMVRFTKTIGKISNSSKIDEVYLNINDDSIFVKTSIADYPNGEVAASFSESNLKKQELRVPLNTTNWKQEEGVNYLLNRNSFAMFEEGIYYQLYEWNKTKLIRLSLINGKEYEIYGLESKAPCDIISSPDGNTLAFYQEGKTCVYAVNGNKLNLKYSFDSEEMKTPFSKINRNGRYLFFNSENESFVCNIDTGKKFFYSKTTVGNFSPNGIYFAVYDFNKNKMTVYETSTWSSIFEIKKGGRYPFFSSDGKYLASYIFEKGKWYCRIFSTASWNILQEISVQSTPLNNIFSSNNRKIIGVEANGTICCYSLETGELLSRTTMDENGDWLTYTPEGYFDGSINAVDKFIHVVDGLKVTNIGQFADILYRPDLVAAKLRGDDIKQESSLPSLAQIISTGDAPLVKFTNTPLQSTSRDAQITFTVQDQGGGIGAVYISLNGKVIQLAEGSRKLQLIGAGDIQANPTNGGKTITYAHPVSLQNGENIIEAYAMNSAGKIESRKAVTKITWQGKTEKPSLYVLSIGVNKYRDRSLQLNYAVPDATSIAQKFGTGKGSLYQSVTVTELLDANVTKTGIESAFNSLSAKIKPDDVFVLYLSGHGMTHTDGDYYFIPVDFLYRSSEDIPDKGISKKFLTENLGKILAQKSLILLDTCNSGSFISQGQRGISEKTAIDRLNRATGQAIISASSDAQVAMEGYNGHGIFTYVVLEALSGKADMNKDGYVSISELSQYVDDKVPDLSYEKWGYSQVPMRETRKMDFLLIEK